MLMAILAILFTLILTIGTHEAGHALAARLAKVTITKVSMGFGRPLLSWKSQSGCEWILALWPLGGYVQLLNTRVARVSPEQLPYCFDKQPIWKRIAILLAGSIANLVFAWLIFIFIFLVGLNYQPPIVKSIQPSSIAALAGVQPGDQFIALDNQATPSYREVGMKLIENWGSKNVKITFKQKNEEIIILIFDLSRLVFSPRHHSLLNSIGIIPDFKTHVLKRPSLSLHEALHESSEKIDELASFLFIILIQLIRGVIPFSALIGPLGFYALSMNSMIQGGLVFMYFIATLSTAVGLINLLPIPGLDGGSIVYALIEKIRGKPISIALEVLIHRLFFIVFCILLVHLTLNDLQR
ncbi:MAG: site-2 protease family protein [Legionella sp.]|nr:site-2 protease family protein [Legionella sp.]